MKDEPTNPLPTCPRCGQTMRFARSIPGIGALPELRTYECRPCRTAITEPDDCHRIRDR